MICLIWPVCFIFSSLFYPEEDRLGSWFNYSYFIRYYIWLQINYDEGNTLPNGISGKETVKETVVQEEEVKVCHEILDIGCLLDKV